MLRKLKLFFLKRKIKKAFKEGKVSIKTVSSEGNIELKKVKDVLKHNTIIKDVYKTTLTNGASVTTTEDHNLFVWENEKIKEVKPIEKPSKIVFVKDTHLIEQSVNIEKVESRNFMYDLSVEDNHNFILTSGILVCNSFAPPSSEATIAGFTRTRGYRWPDEQLYYHLIQAANMINLIPPDTGFTLETYPSPWQPLLLMQAMVYALWDLAILWIGEEFSYSLNGISLDISRSDKYQGAASAIQDTVTAQTELAKASVHIMRGLRQSRYIYGRWGLGPYTTGLNVRKWVEGNWAGTGVRF
jgi:hypothetical protein